ncbi:uncharacterized protein LOC104584023 [Brachypodium distachyon]|uniref:uncharacterized protein LOC104584023 n=1 Tax=Brachypodium distachyon TaxID=15368 RepID=UPI00052FE302|nr:uncharacterized protein LOC104584023 [Brachypodium distachyon]|eukprot:XP_010236413.1 uncharacterized protein LOC104584023 [Brachypodium distachyon]
MAGEKKPMTASPDAAPASPRSAAPGQFGTPIRAPAPAAPVVAAAAAAAAERAAQEEQQQKKAVEFKQKHAEFWAEAAALAADLGVDVNFVVFLPGGQLAVNDVFHGDVAGAAARQRAAELREARKAREQITMLEEAEAQLPELKAALESRRQELMAAAASTSDADGPDYFAEL